MKTKTWIQNRHAYSIVVKGVENMTCVEFKFQLRLLHLLLNYSIFWNWLKTCKIGRWLPELLFHDIFYTTIIIFESVSILSLTVKNNCMNTIYFASYEFIVGQTNLFGFCLATSLGKEQLWIQRQLVICASKFTLQNQLAIENCSKNI